MFENSSLSAKGTILVPPLAPFLNMDAKEKKRLRPLKWHQNSSPRGAELRTSKKLPKGSSFGSLFFSQCKVWWITLRHKEEILTVKYADYTLHALINKPTCMLAHLICILWDFNKQFYMHADIGKGNNCSRNKDVTMLYKQYI